MDAAVVGGLPCRLGSLLAPPLLMTQVQRPKCAVQAKTAPFHLISPFVPFSVVVGACTDPLATHFPVYPKTLYLSVFTMALKARWFWVVSLRVFV